MTPRSLFVIITKVLGLFMLKELFANSKDLIFHIMRLLSSSYEGYTDITWYALFVIVDALIIYVFVFKPEIVINRLKLDKGFYEEQFTMSMDRTMMINIVVIVTGLYLLIDNVPELFKYLVKYYNSDSYRKPGYEGPDYNVHNIIFCSIKIIIAYVMLTNNEYIANFITKRDNKIKD